MWMWMLVCRRCLCARWARMTRMLETSPMHSYPGTPSHIPFIPPSCTPSFNPPPFLHSFPLSLLLTLRHASFLLSPIPPSLFHSFPLPLLPSSTLSLRHLNVCRSPTSSPSSALPALLHSPRAMCHCSCTLLLHSLLLVSTLLHILLLLFPSHPSSS